ncbi:uncharacterized protein OCT59_027421 [Rhizophagus irregularis]|uniref:Kelch-like protein 17 n=2 Tax=Rhizophagus irregularis TaxID=588596 RepID=A0A015LHA8_RHIIW|nr:hypothetical protein RirG_236580 [Rhizophagus irregularis DAOM 197198w]UZO07123.1 hypothetical protein OCT59_027421 [Rhizophagus irregularis]
MIDNNLLQNLSQNLLKILDDEEYYDITIEVGSKPNVNIFRAHKVILYYRSPYLRKILSTNKKKNNGTLTHVKLPNILPKIFQIILRYIYGGTLSLSEYKTSDIFRILVAANELRIQELIILLQSFLIKNKSEWLELNINNVYQEIFENEPFSALQKYYNNLISDDPDKILKSLDLSSTPENLLLALIKSDKLQKNAIHVWEYVIKWGHAQNPELSSDPTDFSKEDFNTLKNSLQGYIPHIKLKLYNLASLEFSNKVLPYKRILPKELYKDLLKSYLKPSNQAIKKTEPNIFKDVENVNEINPKNIDSKIITSQHAELILKGINMNNSNIFTSIFSKFIKDKDTTPATVNATFKLLLRGTRDGFTSKKFHETCDDQSHTVTIIKVKDNNEILGGYNPVAWKSDNSFGGTKDCFIFSFKGDNNIENHILSRIKYEHESMAIFNSNWAGSSFSTNDLSLDEGVGYCSQLYYEKPIRETTNNFLVEEYEVFQIIRH